MSWFNRLLLGTTMSWVGSATLGLLFAACASGRFSLNTLRLPAVAQVALIGSTIVSIIIAPLAVWSLRAGARNLCIYGPILWIILAAYVVLVIPRTGPFGLHGLFFLAILGLVILGSIPLPSDV